MSTRHSLPNSGTAACCVCCSWAWCARGRALQLEFGVRDYCHLKWVLEWFSRGCRTGQHYAPDRSVLRVGVRETDGGCGYLRLRDFHPAAHKRTWCMALKSQLFPRCVFTSYNAFPRTASCRKTIHAAHKKPASLGHRLKDSLPALPRNMR